MIDCKKSYLENSWVTFTDGPYYITVRAINNIEYGGALSTSFCHSTPYIVDNSPPLVYEVYNVRYDEDKFNLSLTHNSSWVDYYAKSPLVKLMHR